MRGGIGEGDYEVQTSSFNTHHGDIMYNVGNRVDNIRITMCGDRWLLGILIFTF